MRAHTDGEGAIFTRTISPEELIPLTSGDLEVQPSGRGAGGQGRVSTALAAASSAGETPACVHRGPQPVLLSPRLPHPHRYASGSRLEKEHLLDGPRSSTSATQSAGSSMLPWLLPLSPRPASSSAAPLSPLNTRNTARQQRPGSAVLLGYAGLERAPLAVCLARGSMPASMPHLMELGSVAEVPGASGDAGSMVPAAVDGAIQAPEAAAAAALPAHAHCPHRQQGQQAEVHGQEAERDPQEERVREVVMLLQQTRQGLKPPYAPGLANPGPAKPSFLGTHPPHPSQGSGLTGAGMAGPLSHGNSNPGNDAALAWLSSMGCHGAMMPDHEEAAANARAVVLRQEDEEAWEQEALGGTQEQQQQPQVLGGSQGQGTATEQQREVEMPAVEQQVLAAPRQQQAQQQEVRLPEDGHGLIAAADFVLGLHAAATEAGQAAEPGSGKPDSATAAAPGLGECTITGVSSDLRRRALLLLQAPTTNAPEVLPHEQAQEPGHVQWKQLAAAQLQQVAVLATQLGQQRQEEAPLEGASSPLRLVAVWTVQHPTTNE